MRPWALVSAWLVVSAGACGRSPSPDAAPEAEPSDAQSAADGSSSDAELMLIWALDAKKRVVTHFLSASGKEVSRPGLFIAVGSKLLEWKKRTTRRKSGACPLGPNPYSEYELETVSLEIVGEARASALLPSARDAAAMAKSPDDIASDSYTPVASLGPYLFTRGDTVFWPCGMHPQYGAAFYPFRIEPDGTPAGLAERDLQVDASSKLGEALAQLNRDASSDPGSLDGVATADNVRTTLAYPSFARGLSWSVQYTTDASWAGSFGGWSGYTRSVIVELPTVPEQLRSLAPLAERATAYAKAHPSEEVRGVSRGAVRLPK